MTQRCGWARNELSVAYHDAEWGVPKHDERTLFEFLILEGAQAGLSWDTILKKRAAYAEAFADFDAEQVARFTPARVEKLMGNAGIVRNRAKIESAIGNAKAVLKVRDELGSLDALVWRYTGTEDGSPRVNARASLGSVPASTPESDAMSKELKRRGFKFVGTTICYAYMQAVGIVNDHVTTCFRYAELMRGARRKSR